MSFAKYAQLYRENGFFSGSKIRATITDNTFIGQEMILSKGNTTLQTRTIPVSGICEFFTDASGTLTLSADDGTSTIIGTVNVSAYGTYEVTLSSASSVRSRIVYRTPLNLVFYSNDTSKTVQYAYTGDEASVTTTSTDETVATATVDKNIVTVNKTAGDTDGTCKIALRVGATQDYDQKVVNINVTRHGVLGEWATASDETIASMVASADAGEINLHDYWHVGDTRVVTLDAITKDEGSVILAQPQQQIELVLMHDTLSDNKYELTTPVASNRTRPSFVVGMKNCLQNLSPLDFTSSSITLTAMYENVTDTETYTHYTLNADQWLNNKFYNALPEAIRTLLKSVNVHYLKNDMVKYYDIPSEEVVCNTNGTKSQKIAFPSVYELTGQRVAWWNYSSQFKLTAPDGTAYSALGIVYKNGGNAANVSNSERSSDAINLAYEGSKFTYYNTYKNTLKKRGDIEYVGYYTRTEMDMAFLQKRTSTSGSHYFPQIMAMGVKTATLGDSSSTPSFRSSDLTSFDKADYASTYYGISPIMFI